MPNEKPEIDQKTKQDTQEILDEVLTLKIFSGEQVCYEV